MRKDPRTGVGLTMGQIVESVRKVADIMAEINAASQAQSAGIDEIGRAVVSMDEMTQQNSALVEEASAAAESLTDQTNQLSIALNVFKLAGATVTAPALTYGQAHPGVRSDNPTNWRGQV